MKKKTIILIAVSLFLVFALFGYSFYQISSLKNELQSFKVSPEKQEEEIEEPREETVTQEKFQDYKFQVNNKLKELEKRADTTNSTFRKMRNAVLKYMAKDADVASLKEDILNILKIF